jgi:hypothetical protein
LVWCDNHWGRVTNLELSGNNLVGSIPKSIGNLNQLTGINFGYNQLTGSIPNDIGSLINLSSLILGGNQLTGNIPASIGNLPLKYYLWLSQNRLSGSIPASFDKLTQLNDLRLDNNQLSGAVPAGIGALPQLKVFSVFNNQITSLTTFTGTYRTDDPKGGLPVYGNRLTFESLEANISKFTSTSNYSPQDSVGIAANQSLTSGQSLQLSALVGGAKNRYQWTRNGAYIAGANNESLTVTTVGAYGCEITNTLVSGLTLNRRRVNVSFAKQNQTITFLPIPTQTFDTKTVLVFATASSGLPVSFSLVSGPATLAGVTLTFTGIGTVVLQASQPGNENYQAAANVQQSVVVNQGNQTISFAPLADKYSTDKSFTLLATASSGLPVTFSIVSGPATLNGDIVTLTGSGVVKVKAIQSGNKNYKAAVEVERTFTVQTVLALTSAVYSEVEVYPNPAKDQFTIELPPVLHNGNISLINSQGQTIEERQIKGEPQHIFKVKQLAKGLYLLQVQNGSFNVIKKVIVE